MQISCLKCKGKNPANCGRTFCPILAKNNALFKVQDSISEDFSGGSPNVFVGRIGYPYLNVGILAPPGIRDSADYDAPRQWAASDYNIQSIINLRSSLVNSRFKIGVMESNRFLELSQEIGMASKPVDVEVTLKDKPSIKMDTGAEVTPMGPAASLKRAEITSNPHIDTRVDKTVSDIDLKSTEAIRYLYSKNFDENFLTKILSIGNLGVKLQRRLVPTRWSITAVDDNLGKMFTAEIKDFPQVKDYTTFFGSYLGNYYLILMFPEPWSYELFEGYMPNASWNISSSIKFTTDYEPYSGRKSYAENCVGGYYAARLPILEKLREMKRQASVLTLRFITGEYACPLGVWVCREATRKALNTRLEFSSKDLMLKYAWALIKKKFGYDINDILNKSIILKEIKSQSKLKDFF
ncbi:hypothetical protein KY330_05650 [Candidatus Woesearchaeota archaeon]|nr:hypothetical protein [Candidatus Woesearchaeota archaeon]